MKFFAAVLLFLMIPCIAFADSLDEGIKAWNDDDYKTAAKLFQPLADQGNAKAQAYLCDMYGHGSGVKEDEAVAADYCRKAAEQGYVYAESRLGGMYRHGTGVKKDAKEAFAWLSKAAEQGDSFSQASLSAMYENGEGVKVDKVLAYKWANIAETADDHGEDISELISNELIRLAKKMTPLEVAEAKRMANEWRTNDAARREREGHTSPKTFFLTFILPGLLMAFLPGRQQRFDYSYRIFPWIAFCVILLAPAFAVVTEAPPGQDFGTALTKAMMWTVIGTIALVYAARRCSSEKLSYLEGLIFVGGTVWGYGKVLFGVPLLIGVVLWSLFMSALNDLTGKAIRTPTQYHRLVARLAKNRIDL